jgi:adenylyl-sulfate kinase
MSIELSEFEQALPGCVVWLTGISGSGKSTIAAAMLKYFRQRQLSVFSLDGDVLRSGLSSDLSFSAEDRLENVRRAAEVAYLTSSDGLNTVVSMISPAQRGRDLAKSIIRHGRFVLVYVNTPMDVAEARDVKGLYKRARSGGIAQFTGIGSAYEVPDEPDVEIDTLTMNPQQAAQQIGSFIEKKYHI